MRRGRPARALILCALVARAAASRADVPGFSTGIDALHFAPGVGRGAFIGIDGAAPEAGHAALAVSLLGARGLLSLDGKYTGLPASEPVRSMVALDAAADLGVSPRLSFGVGVPVLVGALGDRLAGLGAGPGEERPLAAGSVGDLRLRARLRLVELPASPPSTDPGAEPRLSLSALLVGTLPLGGERDFFATAGPTLEPRLSLTAQLAGAWLSLGARLGFRFEPERTLAQTTFSHAFRGALGLRFAVPRQVARRFALLVEAEGQTDYRVRAPGWLELRAALRIVAAPWLSVDAGGALDPDAAHHRLLVIARVAL